MSINILPDSHPYFASCREGRLVDIEMFFQDGISVYASGEHLESPALIHAIDQKNTQFLDLLIRHGLDINLKDGELQMSALLMALDRRYLNVARFLIERGADVNTSNLAELTPLMYAAAIGDIDFLECLLRAGARKDAIDYRGRDTFGYACEEGSLEAVRWLNKSGFPINVRYGDGECPLIIATKRNRPLIVKWLLSAGANPKAMDNEGKTAIVLARELGRSEVERILSAPGKKC